MKNNFWLITDKKNPKPWKKAKEQPSSYFSLAVIAASHIDKPDAINLSSSGAYDYYY